MCMFTTEIVIVPLRPFETIQIVTDFEILKMEFNLRLNRLMVIDGQESDPFASTDIDCHCWRTLIIT